MRRVDAHRLAEERSLALHREVAEGLRRDPSRLEQARARVRAWSKDGCMHPYYSERWIRLLDGPFEELLRVLVDESEDARALRQSTPFAGFVDPRVRWKIWRDVGARMSRRA
jgi:hypothetical protein